MAKFIEGNLDATGLKVGIVVSRFNVFITEHLLTGAINELISHGINEGDIEVIRVRHRKINRLIIHGTNKAR